MGDPIRGSYTRKAIAKKPDKCQYFISYDIICQAHAINVFLKNPNP
jgi:hypothetical protein